jgi:hypothetical protein
MLRPFAPAWGAGRDDGSPLQIDTQAPMAAECRFPAKFPTDAMDSPLRLCDFRASLGG